MKAKINYKSRKTIIIIAIAVILVIAAIAGTVAFIKGNNNAAAAMPEDEQTTIGDAQNNNGGDANQNGGNPSENPSDNPQTELPAVEADNNGTTTEGNNGTTGTTNGGTTTNGNGTGATTGTTTGTAGTGATVPNQDYTQTTTVITENPWETKTIGWSPLSISAYTAVANLGINKPDLATEKLAYVQGDSLDKLPENTAIQKGEVITYVIKVTNKGNLNATSIRTIDTVPAGTELVDGSITANGTESNGKITWKTDIEAGKPVELSFQVKVVADSINLIENTAKVNGTETPTTQNPVITSDKQASVVILKDGEEALEDRDAKVGETIRYTITAINKSEVDGTTIITDKVPTGTTYVADSASEGAVVADDGTITWEKVTVPAGEEVTVSFDVTVNKEIYNEETQQNESVKSVKNTATVGTIPTGEVETKVANITTTKASQPSATPLHELDTITYRLIATNYGNGTGTVTISDKIPEGTTLVGDVTVTGDTKEYNEIQLNNGISVDLEAGETKSVTFTVRINPFKLGDKNVTEKDGKTIRTIKNEVAAQDGNSITGTTDVVIKEYTSVKVNKTWVDNETQAKRRPDKIRFELYAGNNSTSIEHYDMDSTTESTYTFEKLSKYNSDGTPIIYTVRETAINTGDLKFYKSTTAQNDPSVDANGNKTYNFTNTFKRPTDAKIITVTKVWDDNNNAAGKRPDSVTLNLNDDGVVLTAEDNAQASNGNIWSATLTKPVYNDNGEEITYTLTEENIPKWYEAKVDEYTVTNTFKAPTDQKYDITLTKIWDDNQNEAGKRPTAITLTLNKIDVNGNTVKVEDVELTGGSTESQWTKTVNVQKYDEKANEIQYFAIENSTGSKFYTNTDTDTTDLTITNKFVVPDDKVDITIRKVWDDNNNEAGKRPEKITLTLNKIDVNGNTVKVEDVELTGGSTESQWTETINVQKYDEKANEIQYFAIENSTGSKFYTNTDTDTTDLTITNKFVVPDDKVDITIRKVWDDNNNEAGKRPEKITLTLNKIDVNGNTVKVEDVELTGGSTESQWTKTVNVQKYDEKANEIQYFAIENSTGSKFYTNTDTDTTDLTITNKFVVPDDKVDITIRKVWDDKNNEAGKRPEKITLTLNKIDVNGNTVKVEDVELTGGSTESQWTETINVQKYDEKANEIQYFAIENSTGSKFYTNTDTDTTDLTITNKFVVPDDKVDITIRKVWDDNNNEAGKRPEKITLTLNKIDVNGNTVKVEDVELTGGSTESQWTKTVNVQKYDEKANEIQYFAIENSTGSKFYTNTDTDTTDLTITNKFVVPDDKVDITIRKVWDDNNNAPVNASDEKGPRPTEITLVFNDGSKDIERTLTGTGNTWAQSYDLPKYDSEGNEITYTVDEKEVPDWYVKSSLNTTTNTITNSIPRLNVTKEVYSLNGTPITPETGKEATASVKSGDVIGYKITVINTGNIALNNVTVTDVMTNGKTVYKEYNKETGKLSAPISNNIVASGEQIAVNSPKEFIVYYKVDDADVKYVKDADGKDITIDNTATATESYKDGKGNDRVIESIDEASVGIAYSESITIKKEQKINGVELDSTGKKLNGEQVSVTPNTKIEYTITVANTGNTVQENVVVTDIMNNTPNGNSRNVTIKSVKVNGVNRDYTFANGVLTLGVNLDVDETAIITAEYTVGTADMTASVGKIQNKVSVTTETNPKDPTNPIEDEVEVPTEAWAPNITVLKSGKLADGTDANGNDAEYGSTITYTLTAINSGNAPGTAVLKDADLSKLLEDGKLSNVREIVVNDVDANGNPRTITDKKVTDIISGITVNVPAKEGETDGTASVSFKVTVTACPDSDNPISNSVKGGTTPVVTRVVKTIKAKSNTGKVSGANYVLIIDTSSSMTSNYVYVNKKEKITRFAAAKEAISDLATFLFAKDSETTSKISIVQFNREKDTKIVSVGEKIVFGVEDYNNGNITQLIGNITTHSGTNIEAGLKKAGDLLYDDTTGIHKQGLTTNNKDVLILLSDGSPYQGELEPYKLGKIARKQLNRKGEGITNDIYSIAFGSSESKDTLQAISPSKVYLSSNKKELFATFKDIVYEAGDSTPVTLTKASQVIYTGNKEIAGDKEITITYDGLETPLTYTFTASGTSEDGVLTYAVEEGTYTLTFNLTAALLDKENILITYYVK